MIVEIQRPDGKTVEIEAPDGSTNEQIMSFVNQNRDEINSMTAVSSSSETAGETGNILNSLSQGLTMGFGDEIGAAGAALIGKAIGDHPKKSISDIYNGVLSNIRQADTDFADRNPKTALAAEIAGSMVTGGAAGAKLLGKAPTLARAAGVGAAEGGLYGFGTGEGLEDSAKNALLQGATGAVAAPLMQLGVNKVADRFLKKEAKSIQQALTPDRTVDSIKRESQNFYNKASESGVKVKSSHYKDFKDKLISDLGSESVDGVVYPQLNKTLKRISSLKNVEYKDLQAIKTLLKASKKNADPAVRKYAGMIDNRVDEFVEKLTPDKLIGGNPEELSSNLQQARKLWHEKSKIEKLTDIEYRAKLASDDLTDFPGDKELSTQIKGLLRSDKRRLGLSKDEITKLEDIVTGSVGTKISRGMASFDPSASSNRGALPITAPILAAGGGTLVGGPMGMIAAAAPLVAGTIGTRISNKSSKRLFEELKDGIVNNDQLSLEEILKELKKGTLTNPSTGAATGGLLGLINGQE